MYRLEVSLLSLSVICGRTSCASAAKIMIASGAFCNPVGFAPVAPKSVKSYRGRAEMSVLTCYKREVAKQDEWDGPSIKQERHARGWSQTTLANKLINAANDRNMPIPNSLALVSIISNWENRRPNRSHHPDGRYQALFNIVFGKPPVSVLESDEYKELTFLREIQSSVEAEVMREEIERALSIRPYDLSLFTKATEELRKLDRQGNQPDTVLKLQRHVDKIERVFNDLINPEVRLTLARTLADTAAIGAWAALDRGNMQDSRRLFDVAINAASFAGDRSLIAFSTAQRAFLLIDLGKSDLAQDLVAEILREYRRFVPSELAAWLYGAQAEAAAANGNADQCKKALDLGRVRLGEAGPSGQCPYVVLDELHFDRWAGSCLAKIGDADAIKGLERARSEIHPDFARAFVGVLVDLTQAYVARGEFDGAEEVFKHAFRTAESIGSERQRHRLEKLSEQWPPRPLLGEFKRQRRRLK